MPKTIETEITEIQFILTTSTNQKDKKPEDYCGENTRFILKTIKYLKYIAATSLPTSIIIMLKDLNPTIPLEHQIIIYNTLFAMLMAYLMLESIGTICTTKILKKHQLQIELNKNNIELKTARSISKYSMQSILETKFYIKNNLDNHNTALGRIKALAAFITTAPAISLYVQIKNTTSLTTSFSNIINNALNGETMAATLILCTLLTAISGGYTIITAFKVANNNSKLLSIINLSIKLKKFSRKIYFAKNQTPSTNRYSNRIINLGLTHSNNISTNSLNCTFAANKRKNF